MTAVEQPLPVYRPPLWRRLYGPLITVLWLGMMYSLVRDAILPQTQAMRTTEVDLTTLATGWKDVDEYYRLVNDGKNVGGARITIAETTTFPLGYRSDFALSLTLNWFGKDLAFVINAAIQLDREFKMTDFHAQLRSGPVVAQLQGSMAPDHRLLMRVRIGDTTLSGQASEMAIQLEQPLSLLEGIRPLLLRNREMVVGEAYALPVIDPIWQMERGVIRMTVEEKEPIEVGGTYFQAYRIRNEFAGQQTYSWVTDDGRVIRRQLLADRAIFMDVSRAEAMPLQQETLAKRLEIVTIRPEDIAGATTMRLEDLDFSTVFGLLDAIPTQGLR